MKSLKTLVAVTAGVAAGLTLSPRAHAEEIAQVSQTRPNQSMLTSGAFAVGVPYIASIVVAAGSSHPGDKNLFIPVAGPWMDLGDRHCPAGGSCGHEGLYKGLLIADGIFQSLGALEIAGAFLFPETVTVTQTGQRTRRTGVHVTPASVGGGYGLAAVGAF
jgi:hypothetical protein